MGNTFKDLGDIDNRFSVSIDSKDDQVFNKSIYDNIRSKVDMNAISDTIMKGLNNGPNVTRVKDNITGDQYALIAYTDITPDYESNGKTLEKSVITKYTAAEIKNGIAVGGEDDVYRKMGIPTGLGFPESQPGVGKRNPMDFTKPENLRGLVIRAQQSNRIDLKERAVAVDYRGAVRQHYKLNDGLGLFVEEKASEIANLNEALERIDAENTGKSLSFDQKMIVDAKKVAIQEKIENHKIDGVRAVISPGLFELDQNGKAFLSDSANLTNKFAQINDSSLISLTDVEGRYSIGKVSEQSARNSPIVLQGDTIVNSIRVRATGDKADTNIYAVNDGQETWIRAERIEADGVTMINGDALKAIGIDADKLLMGGEHPEARVSAQISPRALREQISGAQIQLNNKVMTNTLTSESLSNIKASSLATDTEEAVTAKVIDNRWSVEELSRLQIEKLEELDVIPSANKRATKGFDYAQTYSAIVVTDNNHDNSAGPRARIIGQSIINSDYNSAPGQKKASVVDYEVFMPAVNDTDNRGMGWVPGDVFIDTSAAVVAASLSDEGPAINPVHLDGKPLYGSYEITPDTVMKTLLDSEAAGSKADAKMTNKYGMGGIDETIIAHQASIKADAPDDGFDWGQELAQEAAKPSRRNTM